MLIRSATIFMFKEFTVCIFILLILHKQAETCVLPLKYSDSAAYRKGTTELFADRQLRVVVTKVLCDIL
uniref:Putative secreted protein n=1 Tax=Ixodes ricinus TaxID=34613 RepID=A0A6B0U1N3_IXORI